MALMTRTQFTQQYGPAVNRYLDTVRANFIKDRALSAPQWSQLYHVQSTNKEHVSITSQTGFGTFRPIAEGGAVEIEGVQQGYPKTFSWTEHGLGFAVTDKMIRFQKFDQMSKMMKSLLTAEANSIELIKAIPINNAFSSSYPTPDGKALCATDHPILRTGGTQSNMLSSTDLSPASAELVLTAWRTSLTDDGYPAMLGRPRVVIAPSMIWLAEKVFNSPMRYDTANNEQNAVKGQVAGIMPYDWMTLSGTWFLQVDNTQSDMNPLNHWWVDKPYGYQVTDPNTFTITKARRFFGGEGTTHYLGIFGVQA